MLALDPRACPLCGPAAEKTELYPANFVDGDLNSAVFSARRSPDRKHFRFVECRSCGMIFSDPACSPDRLSSLYLDSAVHYGAQEKEIYESYAPVLDRALARTARRGTFLEIGGGRGFMLEYGARNRFDSQIEIEPSADAEKKFSPVSPKSKFMRGIFKPGLLPKNSMSLVCFFQMLDHVPDPRAFLGEVFEVLEPGGVAVCVTHDTKSWSAKLLGERSPIFDIEHTYLFHRENLTKLFSELGFVDSEAFRVSNRYALRYWLNLAPLPKWLKGPVLRFLEAVRLADLKVRLNAGNLAVIGTKPQ